MKTLKAQQAYNREVPWDILTIAMKFFQDVKVNLYVQVSFRDDYGISYVTINYVTDFVQGYIT